MRAVTYTKKQIKRFAWIAGLVIAAAAVAITLVVTSVGTRAAKRLVPIYSVDCKEKKIAVTFDVAWENSNTDELISILNDYDAKATFFVTGDFCRRYREDVKKFYDAGHEIENHSDKHPKLAGANVNDIIADTRACSNEIKMTTGEEPTFYRAPSGEYDDNLITTVTGMGMQVVQWDVEAVDTDGKAHRKELAQGAGSFSVFRWIDKQSLFDYVRTPIYTITPQAVSVPNAATSIDHRISTLII